MRSMYRITFHLHTHSFTHSLCVCEHFVHAQFGREIGLAIGLLLAEMENYNPAAFFLGPS